tara:strand:- start:13417 stop:14394 length:978 start_codon:yes stop_codon:yes gene_type:complete
MRIWLLLLGLIAGPLIAADLQRHEMGRELYNYRCYYCHGYSGDAKTLAATFLSPPPRDFSATALEELSRERMIDVVTLGVPKTAMTSFSRYLTPEEMALVVDFVRQEFMQNQLENTRYHTPENGWPDHQRYQSAFDFATGALALDAPQEQMSAEQQQGLRLFLNSCVSCHDRARVEDEGPIWESRAISYPRNNFSYTNFDGTTSASIYTEHDRIPQLQQLTGLQQQGEQLFQDNCAFCHAADGTGKNWIGSFLDAHPRDLTDAGFMGLIDSSRLKMIIRDGVVGTSMPAWKSVLEENQINALVEYISRAFYPVNNKVDVADKSHP